MTAAIKKLTRLQAALRALTKDNAVEEKRHAAALAIHVKRLGRINRGFAALQ